MAEARPIDERAELLLRFGDRQQIRHIDVVRLGPSSESIDQADDLAYVGTVPTSSSAAVGARYFASRRSAPARSISRFS